MSTDAIRKALIENHFPADAGEKLLVHLKVFKDVKPTAASSGSTVGKPRYLCLTQKRDKIRLYKAKRNPNGTFALGKSWSTEDIRRIELNNQFILTLNKPFVWSVELTRDMLIFIAILFDSCRRFTHRTPELHNIDEKDLVRYLALGTDDMKLYTPASSASSSPSPHTQRSPSVSRRQDAPPQASPSSPRDSPPPMQSTQDWDAKRERERQREAAREKQRREKKLQAERERKAHAAAMKDKIAEQASLMNVEELLTDFNWKASGNAAALEKRLVGELQALEAANVHAIIQSDERAQSVTSHVETALTELNDMESWLLLYRGELNSMGEDIREIESQNRGMQILASNQRNLLDELDRLLNAISLPAPCLESLRHDPLDTADDVRKIQSSAELLQRLLKSTLDPELLDMRAVQEKMQFYNYHGNKFSARVSEHINWQFEEQANACNDSRSRTTRKTMTWQPHEMVEDNLIKFQGLLLWLKEMEPRMYNDLQRTYAQTMAPIYDRDIKSLIDAARTFYAPLRNRNPEEMDYLFRIEEPRPVRALAYSASILSGGGGGSDESRAHRYRHMLRESVESVRSGGSNGSGSSGSGSKKNVEEESRIADKAFAQMLEQTNKLVCREQNFMVDLFQHGPNAPKSFLERGPVYARVPDMNELSIRREKIRDVKLSKRIQQGMDLIFEPLETNMIQFIEYGTKSDPTQIISMHAKIEIQKDQILDSDQEYATNLYQAFLQRLERLYERFLNDQVKVVEDTKITTRKRHGVIPFFRTFPLFTARLEKAASHVSTESSTRQMVNKLYEKIIKAMMSSLGSIGRESDQTGDDKDQLNANIMYIENMHHFCHELRTHKIPVLEEWIKFAKEEYEKHLETYIAVVIRPVFGKLGEFFDGVEDKMKSSTPEEVAFHTLYSKTQLRKVISLYPAKEVKRAMEQLHKRVIKHFSEEEGLLQVVWRGIQEATIRQHERMERLIQKCYPDAGVQLEFSVRNLLSYDE